MSEHKKIVGHEARLEHLEINDFRGIGHMELDFHENITVLLAENGGGKTTVLESIARFLQYLYETGIRGKENTSNFGLKETDIKNGQYVSHCKADFFLHYQHPAKDIFELAEGIADYLNVFELLGETATILTISVEDDSDNTVENPDTNPMRWRLLIDEEELIELDEELSRVLANPIQKEGIQDVDTNYVLDEEDSLMIAIKENGIWIPNIHIQSQDVNSPGEHSGKFSCQFEFNRASLSFLPIKPKNEMEPSEFLDTFMERGYIKDYHASMEANPKSLTYPLLVYYGCKSINPKINKADIKYRPKPFQSYDRAFEPDRFEFESFIEWFNSLSPEANAHILSRVKKTLLKFMNSGGEQYSDIRLENGELLIYKKTESNGIYDPISFDQFSTGEKNMFALIGDLTKRTIELNPVLFKVEAVSGKNPLKNTYGIVLIDEIDLHLHPQWQRAIIPTLRTLFPRIQFIIATHSPIVLQEADGYIYKIRNFVPEQQENLFGGWSLEEIYQEMGLQKLVNQKYTDLISEFYEAYGDNNLEKVEENFKKLKQVMPSSGDMLIALRNRIEIMKSGW